MLLKRVKSHEGVTGIEYCNYSVKKNKRNYSITSANEMTPHGLLVAAMATVSIASELSSAPDRAFIRRT